MGKYMRKCRGGAMGEEVTQLVGVRTRSRSASAAISKRRRALPPAPATGDSMGTHLRGESGSCCYLKLRSRMLFMAPPPAPAAPAASAEAAAGGSHQGAVLAGGGISRCSSTASSVDASFSVNKGLLCHPEASKADVGDHIPQLGSVTNSESGRDRQRRETTPSSHLPGEATDLESDLAGQNRSGPLPAQQPTRTTVPLAAEIEEFFAAVEEAEAKRFAAKYNFDVVRGMPLDGGRFEWTPAVSSR